MITNEREIRKQICEVGRRLWHKNWVSANDGNISMRLGDTFVITTPTGVSKGFMTPEMLIKVDMDAHAYNGSLEPSSEIKIHLESYKRRDDIKSVVHAHPPISTGYAVANIPLTYQTLPEVIISMGYVPLAEYGTPSTYELADSISELIICHDAVLLANHGAMTVGKDVMDAYFKMERVELFANISLVAHLLGKMQPISKPDIKKLEDLREKFGVRIGGSACKIPGRGSPSASDIPSGEEEYEDIIKEITQRIMKELKGQ